jgi:DNA-binding transcriptional ArsR family regulator
MAMTRAELIIHPVRLRIIQALGREKLTTQALSERLPDVPQSSLYRHLRLLRQGMVVGVVDRRLINGIQEKVYAVTGGTHLSREDMAQLTADEHLSYFTTYVMSLLQAFAAYVQSSADEQGHVDMASDFAGYTEIIFHADEQELQQFQQALSAALLALVENQETDGRRKYRMAVIAHPTGDQNGRNS